MTLFRRVTSSTAAFALFVGLAGGVWGLALARALTESFPTSPTFRLGPTLLVSAAAAVVAAGLDLLLRHPRFSHQPPDAPLGPGVTPGASALFLAALYVVWPGVAPRVGWTLLSGSLVLTVILIVGQARRLSAPSATLSYSRLVVLLLVGLVLGIYVRTLGSTVGQADTFEFQVVAPTLGIAHPTGYPLYILSGKLFSLLPAGSVAWRVNLTSAVFGAVAAGLLYWLIYRLAKRPLVAFIAALALSVSRVFWSQAVVAEVYALHNMLVAAIVLLMVDALVNRWRDSGARGEAARELSLQGVDVKDKRAPRRLYVIPLLLGLSFANHLTTVLLLPALALAWLFLRPRVGWREGLIAIGLFSLGLSLYLYIYFRWPMLHDGVWMSPGEFWRYVTGQQFGGALRLDAWHSDLTRYRIVWRLLREAFGWPGLALSAVGLVWLAITRWRVAFVTLLVFLAFAWYALSYYVPDVSVFLLPAHVVLAVWLGMGMAAVLNACESVVHLATRANQRWAPRGVQTYGITALISLFALLPLWSLWTNLPVVDQSGERDAYIWGERVLDLPLASEAAILADSARIAPLYYLKRIEGRRPDLDVVVLADEARYRTELETRLATGQTVYLARFLPGLEGLYHLRSLGPLTEVGLAPLLEPPLMDHDLGVRFGPSTAASTMQGDSIELLGLDGPVSGPHGGTGLTLYWRAEGQVNEVYHVRLRLVDDKGQAWWQEEGAHAANNYYPTQAWRPGEVVVDYHEIPPVPVSPADSLDGLTVQVGLFRPFSDAGLVVESDGEWYSLPQLELPAVVDDSAPIHPLNVRVTNAVGAIVPRFGAASRGSERDGGLILVGVDLPDVVTAGVSAELRLHWAAVSASAVSNASGVGGEAGDVEGQESLALTWVDRQGNREGAPVLERWGWSRLLVQAPGAPGNYELRLGLVDQQGELLTARCGWLARPARECALATVNVTTAAAAALANFDGKMLLLDVEFDLPAPSANTLSVLSPGQKLGVTLSWQGLRPIAEDYTISVQLIGPDGRLHGQEDAWPVQGTFPTSQWAPGQRIADPYQVPLSADAPQGRYQVGIAVYLLATQTRLPLVDASGRAIGDIAWVGELQVIQE